MSEPVLLYCVGATKAGTSWFYRVLHDHPDCVLPPVKEAHYWDTFDDSDRCHYAAVFYREAASLLDRAEGAKGGRRAAFEQRAADLRALIRVIEGERHDDSAYLRWLTARGTGKRLVADMTPSYSLLPVAVLRRMAALAPVTRFVYLVRDPLSRLWSHVRMIAQRRPGPAEELGRRANAILRRILEDGREQHVVMRGDYPAAHARLSKAVPAEGLRIEYYERLFTEEGQRDMAQFLGIGYHPAETGRRVHEGMQVAMQDDLAVRAARFLKGHYDWAARTLGPLPQAWQDNLALASRNGA